MTRVIAGALIALALLIAGAAGGWYATAAHYKAKMSSRELAAEQAHSNQLAQVVADASANAKLAVSAAQADKDQADKRAKYYQSLSSKAHDYVAANPALADGCRFGSDLLRVWNDANAGRIDAGKAGDRAGQPGR